MPSSNLITQGLSGSRLLLQGLGGGGGDSASTGSGGVTFGGSAGTSGSGSAVGYHIYMNRGQGDVVDYGSPVATVTGSTWAGAPLAAPGDYRLAVRAFDSSTGQEEQNIDAVIWLRLDAGGNDVSSVPDPPTGLRAFPLAGGAIRVEWTSPCTDARRKPLGFHIDIRPTIGPDSPAPVLSIPWAEGRLGWFSADLAGLTDGLRYAIGVRAFNAVGEASGARVVTIEADSTPPAIVDDLAAVATNQTP